MTNRSIARPHPRVHRALLALAYAACLVGLVAEYALILWLVRP